MTCRRMLFAAFLCAAFVTPTLAQTKVAILVLYDDQDNIAMQGINSSIKYLTQNPTEGVTVTKKYIVALKPGDDIEAAVNSTCDIVDAAIDAGEPPHVVIDTTKTGLVSETAKSFTRALGLPTFSASYGQQGDLREWRNLSSSEKQFLVQVMPPGDIIVQSIRDIVSTQNITNAAIIYDNSFVLDHKYKSLLQNLPCRHIMNMAESNETMLRAQIKKLKDSDLVNYFIVGRLGTIRSVLDAATANMLFWQKNIRGIL